MDKLFSDIQQTLQQSDTGKIKETQQISQDKINQLLEQSSEALLCGPTCQKLKVSDELKKKYLDAETNVKTAPMQLEQSKKNYYVFTEGRTYYDEMMEKELVKKAVTITVLLGKNFNDEVSGAITMNQYLNTALINSSHIEDLLNYYKNQNKVLKMKLRENHGDILTNDRKTYYEEQELERLKLWHKIWYRVYYILVAVFNLCWLLCPSELTWKAKLVLSLLLSFYPAYIDYVLRAIYGFFAMIYSRLPKNVYNNL